MRGEGEPLAGMTELVLGGVSRAGCCHCPCTAASTHAGTCGSAASHPWASAEPARQDFCEPELSEGAGRVKFSACVSSDAVCVSCWVM